MKKIGILTFARVANFGANLQGLSTYLYLKKHGFDPCFIDWEPLDFAVNQEKSEKTIQGKAHFLFFDEKCKKTKKCRTENEILSVIDEDGFDGIIVGSDAVLQHHPVLTRVRFPTKRIISIRYSDSARMFPNPFWGTFICRMQRKIPVVLMSGSSQNSPYSFFSRSLKKKMFAAIQGFDFMTVRDMWTKQMIKSISGGSIDVDITPDPVFAFNENASDIIPSKESVLSKFGLSGRYILLSFTRDGVVSKDWLRDFEFEAKNHGISCYALPMPGGNTFASPFPQIPIPLSPLDWYALIKYSDAYVGQNMHPIVSALHNGVPVFAFDNYGVMKFFDMKCVIQSSKIYQIMKDFSCEDNRVSINERRYKVPAAKSVFESIMRCNRNEMVSVAKNKLELYEKMMSRIVDIMNSARCV